MTSNCHSKDKKESNTIKIGFKFHKIIIIYISKKVNIFSKKGVLPFKELPCSSR